MTTDAGVVSVSGLTKRFGTITAVDDLSFTVAPGRVTGFLGPNGAGKTTTLRMILGLATPDSGTVTIGGVQYRAGDRDGDRMALPCGGVGPGGAAVRKRCSCHLSINLPYLLYIAGW